MAYDLALGQTKDDWSREGRQGGRSEPGRDALAGAALLTMGVVMAAIKGKTSHFTEDTEDPDPKPPHTLRPRPAPSETAIRYIGPHDRETREIPTFEPMQDVVEKGLR
jgi:hypothetical protein